MPTVLPYPKQKDSTGEFWCPLCGMTFHLRYGGEVRVTRLRLKGCWWFPWTCSYSEALRWKCSVCHGSWVSRTKAAHDLLQDMEIEKGGGA